MIFFRNFFITFFILFFIWISVIYFQIDRPTLMSQWVYDVYKKKITIANNIKSKKIIIVAGSNSMFGCDSKKLQKAFGLPVVNFGVNAGVYLPYILYKAKQIIKKDDIVILPLEYSLYNYDGIPNIQMIDYIFSRDFDAFWSLTLKEQFYMIWDIPLKRIYDGYMAKGGSVVKYGLYRSGNIDKYGDQLGATPKAKTTSIKKELDKLKANHYGINYNSNSLGFKYLTNFVQWCKEKNVKVIFTPSTLLYFKTYKNDKTEQWFYTNLSKIIKNKGWIYIGDPYKYMYEKKYYFNTDYHLTTKGRQIRTKQMIKDLSSILK